MRLFVGPLAFLIAATPLAAQDAAPLELARLARPIVVDGVPDDAGWRDVPALPLTMYTPVFRGRPTQRSEIRVAYDDENLYAAGWFYDSSPHEIRVNSLYRDRWAGDDALALYIDAFNDNRNAKWFGITAGGVRFDQLVSDDGATLNGSWDAFWDAETRITAEGWFVEVRIPFSTLGFRTDADGRAVMGLTATRLVSRLDERVTFPEIDPQFEFRRPSLARDVVLRDVRTRTPIYVTPYALVGSERSAIARTDGWGTDRGTSREMGLDVRYPLSGALTLDLTVNTDFAQVEADDQQVNLDRFPLFYPERRRFFQEGSGIFDFVTSGNARLFNSRRIGLDEHLSPVPVYGGARLVGRVGQWDVGFLEMQTEPTRTAPSENFGVLRLRRPVLNQFSTAGVMLTSYSGGGRQNFALGADGVFRVIGDNWLSLRVAGSADDADSAARTLGSHTLYDARWERRTQRGLAYTVSTSRAGPEYRPELGFLPRRDFSTANAVGNWFIYTDDHSWLRRYYPGALAFHTFRNRDGALESAQWAFWVQWDTKAGGGGWLEPKWFHEDVVDSFPVGDADIPPGVYDFADLQLALYMNTGRTLRTGLDLRSGTYYDGTRTQAILTPVWNASRHLELGADYQFTRLRFPERDQRTDIQLVRLRMRVAKDARASGNALVQFNSTADRLDFNLRLRYALAEGTDLWLVYNEGLDTERTRDLGVLSPSSLARTMILKYTHTFGL
jgi:hypothetical protein